MEDQSINSKRALSLSLGSFTDKVQFSFTGAQVDIGFALTLIISLTSATCSLK